MEILCKVRKSSSLGDKIIGLQSNIFFVKLRGMADVTQR